MTILETTRPLADPESALAFILGGNATFTVVSKRTGKRYTYRVRVAPEDHECFFASVLVGPDNTADYQYLGYFIRQDD